MGKRLSGMRKKEVEEKVREREKVEEGSKGESKRERR